jgi:hypothetical protein
LSGFSPQGDQGVEASIKDRAVTIWFSVRTQNGLISVTMAEPLTATR